MSLRPVIVEFDVPQMLKGSGSKLPRSLGIKLTKLVISLTSLVIIGSTLLFAVLTVKHNATTSDKNRQGLNQPQPGNTSQTIALASNGKTKGANPPIITLIASPPSAEQDSTVDLTWSVTNKPTSCTASGDWQGTKSVSGGTEKSPVLSKARNYLFTLSCAGPTGSNSVTLAVNVSPKSAPGTVVGGTPVVTIGSNPIRVSVGGSATLSWSATNNPSSCVAGGDWGGGKSASGSASTGALTAARAYTFSLTCANRLGSGSAAVSVNAIPPPTVALSVSPGSINSGGRVTASWSTSGGPTSCVAGGTGWSGSKAPGGGSQVITINSAGAYTFSLSCSNLVTRSSPVVAVNVVAVVYCGGRSPCYGTADLNSHNTYANCWGYNVSNADPSNRAVYNIGSFNGAWHSPAAGKNLLPGDPAKNTLCGAYNFAPYVAGVSLSGVGGHNHKTSTLQNTNTTMNGFLVGYYDPNKP